MISIWEKETFFAPQDVVIIGSGFTGLWAALHLKKQDPKSRITILERGPVPSGASSRNAGFACFGSLGELISDSNKMGTDKMLTLVEMRYKGLRRIRKFFTDAEIDYEACGGFELYNTKDETTIHQLQQNIAYLNSMLQPITHLKETYKLADEKINKFGFGKTAHLVKNKLEGVLHPGKLLRALLTQVQAMGVQVFNNTEVQYYTQHHERIEVITSQPFEISCQQLLICTNAFTKKLLPDIDIVPARGQVLLTSPIEGLPFQGSFHSDEGYYYFRNLGNRVLLGGARNQALQQEATTEMITTDVIQDHLEKYLHEVVLPGYKKNYSIDFRWSGIMAMGSEKLPIVKEVEPRVFCAVRMSGMGVALAPIAAQSIVRIMREKKD